MPEVRSTGTSRDAYISRQNGLPGLANNAPPARSECSINPDNKSAAAVSGCRAAFAIRRILPIFATLVYADPLRALP